MHLQIRAKQKSCYREKNGTIKTNQDGRIAQLDCLCNFAWSVTHPLESTDRLGSCVPCETSLEIGTPGLHSVTTHVSGCSVL